MSPLQFFCDSWKLRIFFTKMKIGLLKFFEGSLKDSIYRQHGKKCNDDL